MTAVSFSNIKSLVFFGECMLEHRANGTQSFAGDTFNTAWYLSQLMPKRTELELYYASAIGDDNASLNLASLLTHEGLDTSFLNTQSNKALGHYWVQLDENGERHFEFDRFNSPVRAYFKLDARLLEALKQTQFDAFYLSGISLAILCAEQRMQLIDALCQFKQGGGILFFDNNYRASLWADDEPKRWFESIMALSNLAFLTDQDEYAVYGTDNVHSIVQYHGGQSTSPHTLVIRCGSEPCIIACRESPIISVAADNIAAHKIIDTTAAGDAFAAGFLAGVLKGIGFEDAAKFAHHLAGQVIQHHGALMPKNKLLNLIFEE